MPGPTPGPDWVPDDSRAGAVTAEPAAAAKVNGLTGSWGGRREGWQEEGWTLEAGYVGECMGTVSGGLRRGVVVEGLAHATLELDLDKIVGWKGGTFHVCGLFPHGESPTQELVGDLQTVSNIDAFRDRVDLYECFLDQRFGQDRFDVRVGLLLADAEFVVDESSADLFNSGFGWPSGISFNTLSTGPAFFRTALGVRLKYEPSERWFIQAGVYDGDTFDGDPANDDAIDFRLGGDDGMFSIAEVGRRWNTGTNAGGLPGKASVAGWFHTADFPAHLDALHPNGRAGGGLVTFEQTVWREAGATPDAEARRSLTGFLRVGWSPPETGYADWSGDIGLRLAGLLPERFADAMSIGATWVHMSHDFRAAESAASGVFPRHAEVALEWTWRVSLTSWLAVQPDYQWVHAVEDGSGSGDVHVLGLRTHVTF